MLLGKWVRKCGFEAEDKLTVLDLQGWIVVEKEDPNTIDTKLLARIQNESSPTVTQENQRNGTSRSIRTTTVCKRRNQRLNNI